MKVIVATEEVYNDHGDIIAIIYHYEDGTSSEREIFISRIRLTQRNKPLKG